MNSAEIQNLIQNLVNQTIEINYFYEIISKEYSKGRITDPLVHILGELINELDRLRYDFVRESRQKSDVDLTEFNKDYNKITYSEEFLNQVLEKLRNL